MKVDIRLSNERKFLSTHGYFNRFKSTSFPGSLIGKMRDPGDEVGFKFVESTRSNQFKCPVTL